MGPEPAAAAPGYGIPPPGGRLPAATRPGRVRLQVADLERSLDCYHEVLGLRTSERTAGGVSLGAGSGGAPLVELRERAGASPVPPGGRLGLYHFAVLLPDRPSLGRFARHLRRLGVRAGRSDHRVSESFYLRDPDGLGIEVYADRPRAAWARRGRELVITTEPLDVEDLLRAAGDEPWGGAPAGTTIGHLHLRVGNLAAAEAFYHEALGLDRVAWSHPGALFLSAGGYHHHLGVNTWGEAAAAPREGDARLLDWELALPSVEDARAALGRLADAGHPVEETADGGVVRDPWGTALRLRETAGAEP